MSPSQKPFSPACERNQDPILEVLKAELPPKARVLEIGSGTGQHSVYFGANLPGISWQTSDLKQNHQGIHLWLREPNLPNVEPPILLDLLDPLWPKNLPLKYDIIFTANTLHIAPWTAAESLFSKAPRALNTGGLLIIYGPFKYGGKFTSPSNKLFDEDLRKRNPEQGLRDFESLASLAQKNGLKLLRDHSMPANNQTLIFILN